MSREDPPLRIRLPETLRDQMKALAAENRRSMNAEIVARLEASLTARGLGSEAAEGDVAPAHPDDYVRRLHERVNWHDTEIKRLATALKALEKTSS